MRVEFLTSQLASRMSEELGLEFSVFTSTKSLKGYPGWKIFDPSGYARFSPAGSASNSLHVVVFYLHGSLRWSLSRDAEPDFEVFVGDAISARSTPYYRALFPPDGQKVLYGRDREALSDLLAPERKDPFRPGAPCYPMRLAYIFLEKCLNRAKAVLAIGYSFRDSDCRDLLLARWKNHRSPRVVVLDPNPEPVISRLGPLANAGFVAGRFGDPSVLDPLRAELRLNGGEHSIPD